MTDTESIVIAIVLAVISSSLAVEALRLWFARRPMRVAEEFAIRQSARTIEEERRGRIAAAHAEAATSLREPVAMVCALVDGIADELIGPDADYYSPVPRDSRSVVSRAGEAIIQLRRVWTEHPTPSVRKAAKHLADDLGGFYGDAERGRYGNDEGYADRDRLLEHLKLAEELVELLHSSPLASDFDQGR